MNLWDRLRAELTAHNIEIGDDGSVTLHRFEGKTRIPAEGGETAFVKAAQYINDKSDKNAEFLLSLWHQVAKLDPGIETLKPSNEYSRRLFISAVKHLAYQSGQSSILLDDKTHEAVCKLLLRDVASFSQVFMSKVIDFRLAIDWVTHLVQYDRYRALLVTEAEKIPQPEAAQKVATALNFDPDYQRPIPWNQWKSMYMTNSRPSASNPLSENPDERDEMHAYRFTDDNAPLMTDKYDALLGHHVLGEPHDPLLPKEGLATEDRSGVKEWTEFNDKAYDPNAEGETPPGSMRLKPGNNW